MYIKSSFADVFDILITYTGTSINKSFVFLSTDILKFSTPQIPRASLLSSVFSEIIARPFITKV